MSANELKDLGGKAFDAGDYDKAIDLYVQAIALHPQDHVLFSNRSAAYARKNQWAEALVDAEQCIALNPSGWEGFTRKGAALHGAGRYAEAIAAYEEGLKLGDRSALRNGLKEVQDAKATDAEKMFSDPLFGKLDSNPQTQKHLSDSEDVPPAYEDQLRDKLAETDPVVAKELAYSLNRLGVDVSAMGRNKDGPPAYEQTGQNRRKRPGTDPTAAQELANSLNRLGLDLSAIGHHGDALRTSEEAVELPRKFVEINRTITKDLVSSLDRLSVNMNVLGSNEDMSCAARDAGEIHGNDDSSRSSPELEHAGLGSMKTESFVYSADDDSPETPVDSFTTNDLDCLQANLDSGGYLMSVYEPTEAALWMEDNWDKPLLNSIRTSGCGGPFAWMISPTEPAFAIFGSHNEPIVVNMAQSLAEVSGFPVVIRPDSENPALTSLTRVAVPGVEEATRVEDERAPEEPGNGEDPTVTEPDENTVGAHQPNRGGGSEEAGGDGGGDDGPTTVAVDGKWEGPLHETHVKLRVKPDTASRYPLSFDYSFKINCIHNCHSCSHPSLVRHQPGHGNTD